MSKSMEAHIQEIIKFFYFVTLDNKKSLALATEASRIFQLKRNKEKGTPVNQHIVECCYVVWKKRLKNRDVSLAPHSIWKDIFESESIDLSAWKEFISKSDSEEVITIIWSNILGISEKDISRGITTTSGTIRYRLAKAAKKLGEYVGA